MTDSSRSKNCGGPLPAAGAAGGLPLEGRTAVVRGATVTAIPVAKAPGQCFYSVEASDCMPIADGVPPVRSGGDGSMQSVEDGCHGGHAEGNDEDRDESPADWTSNSALRAVDLRVRSAVRRDRGLDGIEARRISAGLVPQPDSVAVCGRPGQFGGLAVVVLGRTATGGWLFVPASSWGTGRARRDVMRSRTAPSMLRDARADRGRGARDRRGPWSRRA